MTEPIRCWTSEEIRKAVEVGHSPSEFPSVDPQFAWLPATVITDAVIERAAGVLLADGGADLTAVPPGKSREEYAWSLAEQIVRAAFDA